MKIRDGDWTLVSHDEKMGKTVWSRPDPDGGTTYRIDRRHDALLDQNKQDLLDSTGQRWGGGRRIASMDMGTFMTHLKDAHDQHDDKYLSRWLNSSDNAKFRTFGGRV